MGKTDDAYLRGYEQGFADGRAQGFIDGDLAAQTKSRQTWRASWATWTTSISLTA
jgi:hypothetical protein